MEMYLKQALQLGFANARLMNVKDLVYIPEYRKYCEENVCGNYDVEVACPPKCGTPEAMRERMLQYNKALILQTELNLPEFDQEKYMVAKREHNVLAEKLMQRMACDGIADYLFMASGPWKNHSCMSAYCIDAQKMADACGLICWGNVGIIRLFSLILVKENSVVSMQTLQGKTVIGGIALAKLLVIKERPEIGKKVINDTVVEIARFDAALENVKTDMQVEIANADSKSKDVLNAQLMMLEDASFIDAVKVKISELEICAEYAAVEVGKTMAADFESMTDSYMQARSEDMKQIAQRVADKLTGFSNKLDLQEEVILMAEEFTPAQLASFDKKYVKGLVAHKGNAASHTTILAGNYGLPYIIGVRSDEKIAGNQAIIDAENGNLFVNPTEEKLNFVKEKLTEKAAILAEVGIATKMKVLANISSIEDVELALKNKADGIGLFRTEFLFMNRDSAPDEEEQYKIYKEVLEAMGDKPVIIRTVDIGTDKPVSYLNMSKEANPALGLRGIRISLADKEMFRVQLRALLRAACFGNAQVMFPMITSVNEILAIQEQVKLAAEELETSKLAYQFPKFGIMIETPAAAVCSDELGRYVDFFSIGTNDLTQYALALDRQAEGLEAYYEPQHEAILRLVEMAIQGAHKKNIPVGICGQLGADTKVLPRLVKAGLDEVSVAIASIPDVRHAIAAVESNNKLDEKTQVEDVSVVGNGFTYTITDPVGIHARPAGEIVKLMKKFDAKVMLNCGNKSANAKKLIELMKLGATKGMKLEITAEGNEAKQALHALQEYMQEKL